MVEESPHTPKYRLELVRIHQARGAALQWTRPKEAETAHRRALPLAERLVVEFPELPACRVVLGNCRIDMMNLLLERGPARRGRAMLSAESHPRRGIGRGIPWRSAYPRASRQEPRGSGTGLQRNRPPRGGRNGYADRRGLVGQTVRRFPQRPVLFSSTPHLPTGSSRSSGTSRSGAAKPRTPIAASSISSSAGQPFFGNGPDFTEQIAHSHRLWAFLLTHQGRLQEAEMSLREAIKVLEKSAADSPVRPRATEATWQYLRVAGQFAG